MKSKKKFKKISKELNDLIPGGCHTYSRGFDQFSNNYPEILLKGKGAYVFDQNRKKYLDYGMGLRSITLGYNHEISTRAAIKNIKLGNNLTLASLTELSAAREISRTVKSAEMVKFAKNGSNVTTAAIKIARAYTNKKIICIPKEHPFFSFDDWFIETTPMKRGILDSNPNIKVFHYNDLESLKKIFKKYKNKIAAVMMEPSTTINPCLSSCNPKFHSSKLMCRNCPNNKKNFLHQVNKICKKNNCLFILDEMITGFRWHLKGAQYFYNIDPDLSTFGKACANGFSVSILSGKKKFMNVGSIVKKKQERTFLLSSTHGGEMSSLGALISTIKFYKNKKVCTHLWDYGEKLKENFISQIKKFSLEQNFEIVGTSILFNYVTKINGKISYPLRTLFMQEMCKKKVLMPWISYSYSHKDKELKYTIKAINNALKICKKAVDEKNIRKYLVGSSSKPVFRKYN
jgi:glutamate-1-semialdehyde 2,1-aminomutase